LRKWKNYSLRHTWFIPLTIIAAVLAGYAVNPTEKNPIHRALFLSYPLGAEYPGGPVMYGKGKQDITFLLFYTVVMSFAREFLMQRLIRPLAVKCNIRGRSKQARFMEQVYTAIYFAIFGPFGLYVMGQGSLWYFNTTAMFEGFPHRSHEAVFKAYYLLQASYWTSQAVVLMLQLEKPRKDYKELVIHHVITLSLIGLSYRFHFAKMGIAVYITHDISDFFLAVSCQASIHCTSTNAQQTSKTLNYLDSIIVGPYFALFACVWIYLRHYINMCILWATLTEFRTVGPFELDWETQQYKCWISQYITFALLASLQAVNLFWLYLILRIAKNFVFNSTATDPRSDDEESSEEGLNEEATKLLQNDTGMKTDSPMVLINGKPAEVEAKAEGIKPRRRRK
jgi:acyl-CoA-dependent ceramide synthase